MSFPLRFSSFLRLASVLGLPAVGLAGVPETWFEWPSVEPLDGSALDVSAMNRGPAGAQGRIGVKDGHFVTPDGARLRFWGANLSGSETFPDAASAKAIARRLSKAGINIVRLHHMDNPWGVESGGSLWPKDHPEHRELDPVALDKLHRLVAELKAVGIYVNLNLKVSKTLTTADGFPSTVSQFTEFQKRVDMYQRRMIELQKDYARRLLTARNPYTGLTLVEDPVVAVVETNNENSILGYWTRDLGRGLDRFPEPFRGELVALWNAWLAKRYPDEQTLARAWSSDLDRPGASVLSPSEKWFEKTYPGGALNLKKGDDPTEIALQVTTADGTDWHAQANLNGLKISDNESYTIEFDARADKARPITVVVGLDGLSAPQETWRSMGLYETVQVGTEWTPLRLGFIAHSVGGDGARLSLNIGQVASQLSLRKLRLYRGAPNCGLKAGQSQLKGTVPIPSEPGQVQWADWIHFLADTDRAFADEMRAFLKGELKVKAPMICSQVDYGALAGLAREQESEWADSHNYWQHPSFPADNSWDRSRWTILNSPQLAEFSERSFGVLGAMAMIRVAGKPFSLSEYDHPAPSEFVCEMYPTLASFGARQDWDAVYPFVTSDYSAGDTDSRIRDFFDQHHHPAKWSFSPFAATLFRKGLIEAAPASVLRIGSPLWGEVPHADILWKKLIPQGPIGFLSTSLGVSDRPLGEGVSARLERAATPSSMPISLGKTSSGAVYLVEGRAALAAVGFLGGATVKTGPLQISCEHFGRDFAAVTLLALDSKAVSESSRLLLTLAARAENQDMGWNASHTSVGDKWGHGPTIAERVPASFVLKIDGPRKVYALAPDGSRAKVIDAEFKAGELRFSVKPADKTMHYEIVAR